MSFKTVPTFKAAPIVGRAAISAANPNRDGTGAIVKIGANAPADGLRIEYVRIKALVTTTAGMVRLYLSDDGGATWFLWREQTIAAIPASATVAAAEYEVVPIRDLELPSGHAIGASTEKAESFQVFSHGGAMG